MNGLTLTGLFLALGLVACSDGTPVVGNVLHPDQTVYAATNSGKVEISYESPRERRFKWDNEDRIVRMIARAEPFEGRTGLYDPAASYELVPSETRLVVQESVLNFANYEAVYKFLKESTSEEDFVYSDDGLAVGFRRAPRRFQVGIDLWQIFVQGKKPAHLVGAHSEAIRLVTVKHCGVAERHC
jgi:hypothetical protein